MSHAPPGNDEQSKTSTGEIAGLRAALDEHAGVVVIDPKGKIISVNDRFCAISGFARNELVGSNFVESTWAAMVSDHVWRGEIKDRAKDGSYYSVETTLMPVAATAVKPRHYIAICTDVTGRSEQDVAAVRLATVETERALREKEAQLNTTDRLLAEIVHGMTEACFALDHEWRFTFVNDRTLTLLRRSREGMIGLSIWTVFPQLNGTPMEAHYRQAMEQRVAVSFEVFSPVAERWLDIRLFPSGDGLAAFLLDIDARKRSEDAVKNNEDRFRTMANSMSQLSWIARADGQIFWYNQRWYEYTGKTPEEMEGWGWQSVHDPEVLSKIVERWQAAVDQVQPFEMEFPLRGADGKFRTFLTRAQPMRDPDGSVAQWFGTNTDVEALKQMETSLRATQALLSSALAAGSIGTWTWDIANDRLSADAFTAEVFGLDAAEVAKGLPAAAYLKAVELEDQPAVAAGLAHAIACCGPYNLEYRVPQKDGSIRWIQARGRVEGDASGKAVSFYGAVMDVTASRLAEEAVRESEEHFRFLNDLGEATRQLTAPDQIMKATAQMLGRHLRASRCAYADVAADGEQFSILHDYTDGCASTVGNYQLSLFGSRAVTTLSRGETMVVRDVDAELLPADGADMFKAIGIQAIVVCPLVKESGLRAMMAVHQSVPRDWQPHEIAIVQDVVERCWATIERSKAEEEIRQLNANLEKRVTERTAQLQAANRELEAFSYSISHDLRAPLRAVNGFAQAVIDGFGSQLPEEGQRKLKVIRGEAQRMGSLIDDLLAFSRLGRQSLARREVDLVGLVQTTLTELGFPWTDRRVEVRVGALGTAYGDPALLKQVWINLLSNSIKYSRKRELALIEIGTLAQEDPVYFVKDNGSGFDMRYAKELFGVFRRMHHADEFEGTGVGLAIVQRIVQRHGGRIWAEAKVNEGATFYFTLGPARKNPGAAPDSPPAQPEGGRNT